VKNEGRTLWTTTNEDRGTSLRFVALYEGGKVGHHNSGSRRASRATSYSKKVSRRTGPPFKRGDLSGRWVEGENCLTRPRFVVDWYMKKKSGIRISGVTQLARTLLRGEACMTTSHCDTRLPRSLECMFPSWLGRIKVRHRPNGLLGQLRAVRTRVLKREMTRHAYTNLVKGKILLKGRLPGGSRMINLASC